jgi:HD-GYP domain-containing protein (c-di-GMP phosphodiesterase class II)
MNNWPRPKETARGSENMKLKISEVKKLKKKIRQLEHLVDASLVFSSTLDIAELLNLVMQVAEKTVEAEASSVFRIDEEKNDLYFLTVRGSKGKEAKDIRVPMGKGIVGWVAKHGKPLLVADVTKDKRFYRVVDKKTQFITRSIIAVPLFIKNKIVGVAEVLNKKGNRRFTPDDQDLFMSLGSQIAVAIENASLYQALDKLFMSSITSIVEAIDAKDPYTKGHSVRVVEYSMRIGERIKLDKDPLKILEVSAILHDVGKIGIPDDILRKPGRLTDEEYAYIKKHPGFGAEIITPIAQMKDLMPNILHHHERFDGQGYPDGLRGKSIPLCARIIAIADSFDAMTSGRLYRSKFTDDQAYQELIDHRGTQFDPKLVDIFIKHRDKTS